VITRQDAQQAAPAARGTERHFQDHHGFICATMLRRIDALAADIAGLDAKIAELVVPFAAAVTRLDQIPGVGVRSAQELIADLGAV
jgi:transposase